MKKTHIKKMIDDLVKSVEQKFGKKCELMTLNMKTCITKKAELFIHVEASISEPGEDGKTFKITKDVDL